MSVHAYKMKAGVYGICAECGRDVHHHLEEMLGELGGQAIESLLRDREADHAAIRALSDLVDVVLREHLPSEHGSCNSSCAHAHIENAAFDAIEQVLTEHAAAIARATGQEGA